MNRLKKLFKPDITPEQEDEILGEMIEYKFDQEMKTKWSEEIKKKYNIHREQTFKVHRSRNIFTIKNIAAVAACTIAFILIVQLLLPTSPSPEELAENFLMEQEILHPGTSKGANDWEENKFKAIQSFNTGKYKEAVQFFEQMTQASEEDNYYHALALLLNGQNRRAIEQFEHTKSIGNKFKEEINWYLAIAYLANNDKEGAKKLLLKINPNDWQYERSQELLEQLK